MSAAPPSAYRRALRVHACGVAHITGSLLLTAAPTLVVQHKQSGKRQ
jgi:hypothetical protein